MSIFDKLRHPALTELIRDQRLREVVLKREFRITEGYCQRELIGRNDDDELQGVVLRFCDGYGEIAGEVKKRLLPFAVPFSVRFSIEKVALTAWEKSLYLKVDQVRPLDLDWVTARVVARVPFLSFREGTIICDLAKVPRLADFFEYRLKGMRLADLLTVKELVLREGELVGRLGFCL